MSRAGTFVVSGPGAKAVSTGLHKRPQSDWPGQAQVQPLVHGDSAGVIDDLFVYVVSDDRSSWCQTRRELLVVGGTVETSTGI